MPVIISVTLFLPFQTVNDFARRINEDRDVFLLFRYPSFSFRARPPSRDGSKSPPSKNEWMNK